MKVHPNRIKPGDNIIIPNEWSRNVEDTHYTTPQTDKPFIKVKVIEVVCTTRIRANRTHSKYYFYGRMTANPKFYINTNDFEETDFVEKA